MSFFKQGSIAACVAAAVLSASATANAGTIAFTDAAWSGANGQGSYTVGQVTASAQPDGKVLTQNGTDGFGVTWPLDFISPDEISNHELLRIDFSAPTTFQSVSVANLFRERICVIFCGSYYLETGYYRVDNGAWTKFQADPGGNGLLTIDLLGVQGSSISFSTLAIVDVKHDFSVRSITVADDQPDPVPEPTMLALLGLTFVGGAARLRRRR